jgi:hypothetical protein
MESEKDMSQIAENLDRIREKIVAAAKKAGRNPSEVTLIAVSKIKPVSAVLEAIQAGQRDFGENYVQEAREKVAAIDLPDVRWHFIGHLQSNKAKYVAPSFNMVHTVDSPKLAKELAKRAKNAGRVLPVLVEVNIAGEQSKTGIDADQVKELVSLVSATEGLSLRGLMTMPPFLPAEQARPYFVALRNLRDELAKDLAPGASLDALSMGMSGDFEVAIEEGATLVRVGTAIFGSR